MRPGPVRLVAIILLLAACAPTLGGRNRGGRSPGSGRTGVRVASGGGREIAVAPSGRYLAYRQGTSLLVADVADGTATEVKGSPADVVAFWAKGEGFFVLSVTRRDGRGAAIETQLASFDRATGQAVWDRSFPRGYGSVLPLADGAGLLLGGEDALLLDAATGQQRGRLGVEGTIVDISEGAAGRVVVTEAAPAPSRPARGAEEAGASGTAEAGATAEGGALEGGATATERAAQQGPASVVHVLDSRSLAPVCEVKVENCADELAITPGGERAFLAPTHCGRDPVSVVNLVNCSLTATLPGFGPVALLRGGSMAVAFADRDRGDPGAPSLPASVSESPSRYHLMLIDARTLTYETVAVGDRLPRYAPAPGDRLLLLDTSQRPPAQIRVLDLGRRTLDLVWGPAVPLSAYVLTPDARHAFVLADGLYDLDVAALELRSLPLAFVPQAINLTPDGATLLLRDEQARIHLLGASPLRSRGLVVPPGDR
jgi:hypothetical protein